MQQLAHVALLVADYDAAIAFYTEKLGFQLLVDAPLSATKRWVVVAPPGGGTGLLLARAATASQRRRIGKQTGGRVFLFLTTDDFWRDYEQLQLRGVVFEELPRQEPYATVAVFQDLYGNRWDLLQPVPARPLLT